MKLSHIGLSLVLLCFYTDYTNGLGVAKSAAIANKYMGKFLALVSWPQGKVEAEDVSLFLKLYQGCVILAPVTDSYHNNDIITRLKSKRIRETVFLASEVTDVEFYLSIFKKDYVASIRVMIVLTRSVSRTGLSKLLRTAWNNDIAEIVVINPTSEDEVSVATYFPYNSNKCEDYTPVFLNPGKDKLFPAKFRNFHKCPIRCLLVQTPPRTMLRVKNDTILDVTGMDWDILNWLLRHVNATIVKILPKDAWNGSIRSDNVTGGFSYLTSARADIHLPALLMTLERYESASIADKLFMVSIVWFGPRRRVLHDWTWIITPIAELFFGFTIMIAIFTKIISRLEASSNLRPHYKDSLIQSYAAFLGLKIKFHKEFKRVTFIFILWIGASLVFRIAYQGFLVEQLQRSFLELQLFSFEQSVQYVEGYGGAKSLRDSYLLDNPLYHKFQDISPEKSMQLLREIDAGKSFLLGTDRLVGSYVAPHAQVLHEEIGTGFKVLTMRPRYPAAADIGLALTRMVETGFIDRVYKNYSWAIKARAVTESVGRRPLSMKNFMGFYHGLAVMYCVCAVVFVAEIGYFRIKSRK